MSYREAMVRPPFNRLAFPRISMRLGVDVFEVTRFDGISALLVFTFVLFAACFVAGAGASPLVFLAPLSPLIFRLRNTLRIDRNGAWEIATVADIPWKKVALGKRPRVENGGYDWDEIGVYPTEPVSGIGLHDDERIVLVEWSWDDKHKAADGELLIALLREQIARLH